jgi:hypothetical protein
MRSLLATLFCVALVAAISAGLLVLRYRIQPLQGSTQPHMVEVYGANTRPCLDFVEDVQPRLVILKQARVSGRVMVFVNQDTSTLDGLAGRLTDIFKTRAEKTVFLIDSSDVDLTSWIALERVVQHVAEIDRICVIDQKHPPSWYPPTPQPAGGGAMQFARR